MLLNVLILDGKIERVRYLISFAIHRPFDSRVQLPAFGSSLWNPDAISDESEGSHTTSKKSKRKRKKDDSDEDRNSGSKRTKRQRDEECLSSDDENDLTRQKSKRKRTKGESDSDSDRHRRKKNQSVSSDESENDDQLVKKVKKQVSSDDSSLSDSESRSRKSKESLRKSHRKHSSSPVISIFDNAGGGTVYRALPEVPTSVGLMEAPCGPCPSFEFCKDGGPVNPQECIYYSEWLSGQTLANEV